MLRKNKNSPVWWEWWWSGDKWSTQRRWRFPGLSQLKSVLTRFVLAAHLSQRWRWFQTQSWTQQRRLESSSRVQNGLSDCNDRKCGSGWSWRLRSPDWTRIGRQSPNARTEDRSFRVPSGPAWWWRPGWSWQPPRRRQRWHVSWWTFLTFGQHLWALHASFRMRNRQF